MKKPIIGITSGYDAGKRKSSLRKNRELYYLNRSYVLSIQKAGGIPIIIPPIDDFTQIDRVLEKIDGLLLTGGHDIHPEVYGVNRVHPKTEKLEWLRQEYELVLTKIALKQGVPLLAICLGIQMLNVAAGGTLIQDVPSEVANPLIHSQKEKRDILTHWVVIDKTSRLYKIVKKVQLKTNTFHHQALAEVAPGFRIVARAADKVIEAIESTDTKFRVGVQWHPEELIIYPNHLALFKSFVRNASK
jgi:putative glutamine amidotransferase